MKDRVSTEDDLGEHKASRCYRMRPYFQNVGIAGTAFFTAIGLLSTLVAYFNVDGSFPRPKLFARILGVFRSVPTLLGAWLILLSYRYRFYVSKSCLRQVDVFKDIRIDLDQVDKWKWRRSSTGGNARAVGPFGVLRIEFGNFNDVDRDDLVSFLRHAIPVIKQIGWNQFNG